MRPVSWSLGAVLVGLTLFEIAMQPTAGERFELGVIFVFMAVAMAAAARWLPQVARRYRSIRITLAVLALAAFSIVVGGAVAVGNRMFFSSHDLTLLLVVIAFGVVSAVGFALSVSGPLTEDLNRLSDRATLVATGHLEHVATIDRNDEVGRLSAALDDMISQLEQADNDRRAHAESRRAFFAAVGHDLRTPLSSMRAAVEAVKDGVVDDPTRYLAAIERDISALTDLVADIYLLARLDSGAVTVETKTVDLTELADEAVEIARPLGALRDIDVRLAVSSRSFAHAAVEPVGRVLRNLLDNAVRHSPAGTAVDLMIQSVDDRAVITVADEGPGFDPDFEAIAFERFSRFEAARTRDSGGSGLGLAIAKSLVEAMGGEIWIAPGAGGRVVFTLPLAAGTRPALPDPVAPRRRTSSRHPA